MRLRGGLHARRQRLRFRAMAQAKVALVTGAGRGIGRDIALRMAKEGYAVGLIARTKSQLDETAERELGPISVLINNAGAYLRKRFTEITEEDFDFQLKVNAYGPFFCTQAVIGKMAERKAGTVIFVLGSESRSGPAQYSAYNASKLAQRAIAESVAYEFMHLGVHAAALDVDGAVDSARVRESMPEVDPAQFVPPTAICDE